MQKALQSGLILVMALFVLSCQNETEDVVLDFGYDYLPTDSGHYVIYKGDSIIYDDFFNPVKVTRVSFYLKEVIQSHFIDNLGRPADRIERYVRNSESDPWQLLNVWYQVVGKTSGERVEDNLRYVKMIFPQQVGDDWFGNKYITEDIPYIEPQFYFPWKYRILSKDVPYVNAWATFDSSITILQEDDSTAINKTYSLEKYARHVGLVYKELWVVKGQTNIGEPWIDRAEKGFIVTLQAIDSGTE